jgi:AraC family transcriptional regulator of adaptative response / DNA-3-methyladenine glycosylase II
VELHGESRLYRAVASRDRRFEGQFVVAVRTTGVYCRPGCPAPIPRRRNVRFFAFAAAAEEAGFRPCLRCRPDASPGSPAWLGTSATVRRALALIDGGALDDGSVDELSHRLGVGARHLRRLFAEQVGASPDAIACTRRAHFARKLIEETSLPMARVAHEAGYASVRRFNAAIRDTFRRPPRTLRVQRDGGASGALSLRLPLKPPYDWDALVSFFQVRAVPGIEEVTAERWTRAVRVGDAAGVIAVRPELGERRLVLEVPPELAAPGGRVLRELVDRVRRAFDLMSDPVAIRARLSEDRALAARVRRRPGLRVPGAWDAFEAGVRAIVGQQVSVAGARTLLGRLAEAHGGRAGERRLFPTALELASARRLEIGMPEARRRTLHAFARAVADGADAVAALDGLRGVGPWTRGYVALRTGDPDGFPEADLGLLRALEVNARELAERAEAWRPYRAYAALHIWMSEADDGK